MTTEATMGERKLAEGWVKFETPGRAPWLKDYQRWHCTSRRHRPDNHSAPAVYGNEAERAGACNHPDCIAQAGVFAPVELWAPWSTGVETVVNPSSPSSPATASSTDGMPCGRFEDSGGGIHAACRKCHWPERVHDNAGLIADLTAQLAARDAEIVALRAEVADADKVMRGLPLFDTSSAWLARVGARRKSLEVTMTPSKDAGNARG